MLIAARLPIIQLNLCYTLSLDPIHGGREEAASYVERERERAVS